uniref:Uncharacterized protein n=1 Tax=Megaselia scalaris TaxID=36166 RepID=T1GPW0_MEGSC
MKKLDISIWKHVAQDKTTWKRLDGKIVSNTIDNEIISKAIDILFNIQGALMIFVRALLERRTYLLHGVSCQGLLIFVCSKLPCWRRDSTGMLPQPQLGNPSVQLKRNIILFLLTLSGVPKTEQILKSWSTSLLPGNNGRKVYNSAIIHPIAHKSIALLYRVECRRTSGALYLE